jgi:TetR/AcrR family transcriptional regulator, mexJK operon transcriptional repressor
VTQVAPALGRGRPPAEASRQKMADVVAAARELFIAYGYRAVTMRQVAEAAQVSIRTLYNRYPDKLALFTACLDCGAAAFPVPRYSAGEDVEAALRRHALSIVQVLSADAALRLGRLVHREAGDFPELLPASEVNEEQFLIQPLATYLRDAGLSQGDELERAKLFLVMTLAEWQRRLTYRRPLPTLDEAAAHVARVVDLFLNGAHLR